MNDEILSSAAWRPIAGFEGIYAVSAYGEVYSFRRGRRLRAYFDRDGYPRVTLLKPGDGTLVERKWHPRVHRLVAEAFHGSDRSALHNEVAHLDGNRANADADNLKWVSRVENCSHKRAHGTHPAGENHPQARLTVAAVRHIRSTNETRSALAAQYGVTPWAIDDVRTRRNWKHVG